MFAFTRSAIGGFVVVGATMAAFTGCSSTDQTLGVTEVTGIAASPARLGPDVSKGLASVRNATARFHNVEVAIAAGYQDPAGIPCVASPAGTMGVHVVNRSLMDQTVDPDMPEALLYLPKANGGFKLIGVEYLVPVLVRNTSTNAVTPWFGDDSWGAGYVQVTPTPSVMGQVFEGPMKGHEPGMPWHYDKHTWIWETNPAGMFAQWNPSISCP